MSYKAEEQVGRLDYDFGPFRPEIKGVTPEPETERIKQYWLSIQEMVRRSQEDLQEWNDRLNAIGSPKDDTPEEKARVRDETRAFNREYEEWQRESADRRIEIRRRALAMVCDEQPSYEELCSLPGRVFDDFEAYMQEELTPKGSRSGLS